MGRTLHVASLFALTLACASGVTSCASLTGPRAPAESTAELDYCFGYNAMAGLSRTLNEVSCREVGGEALERAPKAASQHAWFGTIRLADRDHPFLFDESGGTDAGYDTLYIDANGNGDLTDDEAITSDSDNPGTSLTLAAVPVTVWHDGAPSQYHLNFHFYKGNQCPVLVCSGGRTQGTLELAGKSYAVSLVDEEPNGVFNDRLRIPRRSGKKVYATGGDTLMVDLNGDGKFDKDSQDTAETHRLGEYLCVDGTCYRLTVDPDGRRIRAKRVTGDCGVVELPNPDYSAQLIGPAGGLKVTGAKRTRVPAGDYVFYRMALRKVDENGDEWRAVTNCPWRRADVTVRKGKTTKLVFGEPLTVQTWARLDGSEVDVSLAMTGARHESYAARTIKRVDARKYPPAPGVTIADANGRVVETGRFRWG